MNKAMMAAAVAAAALGAHAAQAQELGRVISSIPLIQQVAVPRQVCTQQQVVSQGNGGTGGGGAVVGAIVGGLLGNTVGGGTGRAVATGVGVLAGAAVGDRMEAGQQQPHMVQNCTTQTVYENRTLGYNVQYEYAGKQYQVQLPYDPGPTIRLQVTPISAAEGSDTVATAAPAPAGQPVAVILADNGPAYVQQRAYYPVAAPYYQPWVPPVSLSLGFGWVGGHRHWR